jgi:hypothetical protein
MSEVLLLINEEAHARELSRVADYLLKTSDLRPVYFVEDRMKPFGVYDKLAASAVETLTSDDFSADNARPTARVQGNWRWASALITFLQALAPRLPKGSGRVLTVFQYIGGVRNQMLRRSAMCEAVFSRRPYAALLLCEDNVDLDTAIWIEAARKRGIRSIIVPYTIANTVELTEAYVFAAPYQIHASLTNRLIARLFPKWATRHKGRHFMRTSYAKIVAVELLGLTPPNPWLLNSGFADVIAVESAAMRDYYRAAGLPATQLVMTGTLVDDAMSDVIADAPRRRRALLEEAGLPFDRPVLLCAFPPDQNVFNRPGCEFSNFDDLINFWGESLAAVQGWNIIVARHPKTRAGRLDALRQYGLTLTEHDTASLVPLCDLYLASVSATIRWAIACAKPVINYDAYRLDFQDYPDVDAVALVKTREDFRRLLAAMTSDFAKLARMQAVQKREAPRWGFQDGRCGRRLLALIRGETFTEPATVRSGRAPYS